MNVRIAFPEIENEVIAQALAQVTGVEAIPAEDLTEACTLVREGRADALVAGIDLPSRDVILACRDEIGVRGKTFSASFVLRRGDEVYVLGDAAACKHPTDEQLFEITEQTYETAQVVLSEPRVALLSFSTFGSGGHDETMERAQKVVEKMRALRPEIKIDGEMQLDTAVSKKVAKKKAPGHLEVAGQANVLIAPDLNTGNVLYKAMEQFGGFTAAGPILQGFNAPCSDLSRGSTVEDVLAVIDVIKKQVKATKGF